MRKETVNQVGVELYSKGVHWVVATSQRYYARPGYGKSVRLDAIFSEESEILLPELVGVCSNVTVSSI
jgi:hypothetical protein